MTKKTNSTAFALFSLSISLATAQVEHTATATGSEVASSPGFTVSDSDLLQTSLDSVNASPLDNRGDSAGDNGYLQGLIPSGEESLRDGVWYDNPGNSRGSAVVENDEFAEFAFDLAASPGGYTISAIDLYSNWGSGQGRDEIRVNVSFSLVATPTVFDQTLVIGPADPLFVYNPPTQTQGKLSLSDFSVSGVAAIRFDWPAGQENNGVGYSEIDVFGTSTGGDVDPPTLSSTSPVHEATDVATTASFVFTFNEDIQAGTGQIDLRSTAPDASVETFDVASSTQLAFDGRTLTITPSNPLLPGEAYQIVIPAGAIDDLAGNDFAGIAATEYTFTTDETAPTLGSAEPLLNGLPSSDFTLQFDEDVQLGTGQITFHLASDNSILETITVPGAEISAEGNTITAAIGDLDFGTAYYANISANTITDLSGNAFPAVTDSTTIAFTTAASTLIHHWEFEDNATDSAGTHDGTLRGGTPFETGQIGLALNTAGNNGMVTTQSSLPATNFTMAVWVNPASINATRHIAGTRRGETEGAQLRLQGGVPTVHLQSESNVVLAGPEAILENEWAHLAFSVDETNGLTLYVNGTQVATDPNGLGHTTVNNFTVGIRPDVITAPYLGLIDDLRIYSEVLSQAQIATLANNEPPVLEAPEIVDFVIEDESVTLRWTSTPDETYSVLFSTDLQNFDGDIDDSHPAAEVGNITEFTFPLSLVGVNVEKAFFRVLRN